MDQMQDLRIIKKLLILKFLDQVVQFGAIMEFQLISSLGLKFHQQKFKWMLGMVQSLIIINRKNLLILII